MTKSQIIVLFQFSPNLTKFLKSYCIPKIYSYLVGYEILSDLVSEKSPSQTLHLIRHTMKFLAILIKAYKFAVSF